MLWTIGIMAIVLILSYFPVKIACHVDTNMFSYWLKKKDRGNESAGLMYICKYVEEVDANWKAVGDSSGLFCEQTESEEGEIYICSNIEREDNPFLHLNSSFDPHVTDNTYVLFLVWCPVEGKESVVFGSRRLFYEKITHWDIAYPIKRQSKFAIAMLPKGWLTIWDFIGPKALPEA